VENNEKHRHAFDKYSDRIVDLWAQWRSEMVKSKTLTSKSISDTLANFFRRVQLQQDGPLTALCQKQNATVADWQAMHNVSKNIATDASQLMEKLAGDLNLTRNDMK
jgi:hypothetical protein